MNNMIRKNILEGRRKDRKTIFEGRRIKLLFKLSCRTIAVSF